MTTSFQARFAPVSAAATVAKAGAMPHSLPSLIGGMARWLVHGSANAVLPMQRTSLRHVRGASQQSSVAATMPACFGHDIVVERASARPVRVLRLSEAGQSRASVGRMVISGRMADVCAELDRLVAREAALH